MNADESQTPNLNTQPLDAAQKTSFKLSSAEDTSLEELQQENLANVLPATSIDKENLADVADLNFDFDSEELNKTSDRSQEDAAVDFLAELEKNISIVEEIEELEDQAQLAAEQRIAQLQGQEQDLKQEIANLQQTHQQLSEQIAQTQTAMGRVVQEALVHLEQRKQSLQLAIEQLERRQERIRAEMRTTFAGTSQDLAIRVQGFKDYLTGSLQDLAAAAEQLELVPKAKPEPQIGQSAVKQPRLEVETQPSAPQFTEQRFQSTTKQIRRLLDQYRSKPDYYGPPWQLRRTFEPAQAEKVADWFFKQGGRGALRSMGSRLQNVLISSAIISVLYTLYDTRLRVLVLANTPERLGDWRRGLQDCLGISRGDFGADRGVVLSESPEGVARTAERLIKANQMPLIIVDDSEDKISLSLLQFPLLLAFAPDPQTGRRDDFDF